ncbi:methylmalonyl-CoA epimerase [bacterium]|nr:methylmalonyl-CoA epimerase [bacterium]
MKLNKIDHIGIAVTDLEAAKKLYEAMGFHYTGHETVDDQKVETAFFEIGESKIELLAATDPSSPIAKFIEKNGNKGGIAHIAINVTNIEEKLKDLKSKGFQLIDETPKTGAHGAKIAFVHPKSTSGVLLELCEKP